ncbi:MAG: glycosyltransferase [Bacteroidota bacterium]|nr:glycosyltransferase [Bacteroidota bacterium]
MSALHIISFDVPYPANYGGVIDVFYKLKQLHKQGIKITLHCFEYGKGEQKELNKYCEKVYYYKRSTSVFHQVSRLPYIVKTRSSDQLLKNLLLDEAPILFEGLHTCGILASQYLEKRLKIYRESNIEHEYYMHLANAEKNIIKQAYYRTESRKLKRFESILSHADKMLVVSKADTDYLKKKFPKSNISYLPSFHPYENVESLTGKGDYILYHGNLGIAENALAARFLITQVFSKIKHKVKIAGLNPMADLKDLTRRYEHIELIENPEEGVLQNLIKNAHINCLHTHQGTGLKLKLLNALFAGRFCLVNDLMLVGTGLEKACEIANEPNNFVDKINELMETVLSAEQIETRKDLLKPFDVKENTKRIVELLS